MCGIEIKEDKCAFFINGLIGNMVRIKDLFLIHGKNFQKMNMMIVLNLLRDIKSADALNAGKYKGGQIEGRH